VISFVIEGIHPHDIGTILDRSKALRFAPDTIARSR
jgi:selenocysteine lyase/cysteine desulfurase